MQGVTEVGGGRVRGVERGGIWTFSGIPYAASPAGNRRWRPPAAPEPWSGVRDCDRFGPVAPQAQILAAIFPGATPEPASEDCLSLNVWTPGLDGAKRPVMVWVHGGSFLSGSGSTGLYRGADLAREGDVVVVTVNYRLGLLGYLAHPALGDAGQTWLDGHEWTGTGNWGLADQVAALRWVHDHIAGFGGDPGCVTLFGESAGGMSVSALLGTPEASGLFHRAVVQSGPPYTMSAETAAEVAEKLASQMGVACTREALEQVPSDRLVAAVAEFERTGDSHVDGLPLRPVVDGGLLLRPPLSSVAAGSVADIPLLIGTTRDEWTLFSMSDPAISSLDADRLRWRLVRAFEDESAADRVIAAVRSARAARGEPVEARDLWTSIATEFVFRAPSVRLADAHEEAAEPGVGTYAYLFTWPSPIFGGVLGSCHALDVPFVFGTVRYPLIQTFTGGGKGALALSAAMRQAWASFARTGVPTSDLAGAASTAWPEWDRGRRPTAVLGPWTEGEGPVRVAERPATRSSRRSKPCLGPVPGHRTR